MAAKSGESRPGSLECPQRQTRSCCRPDGDSHRLCLGELSSLCQIILLTLYFSVAGGRLRRGDCVAGVSPVEISVES